MHGHVLVAKLTSTLVWSDFGKLPTILSATFLLSRSPTTCSVTFADEWRSIEEMHSANLFWRPVLLAAFVNVITTSTGISLPVASSPSLLLVSVALEKPANCLAYYVGYTYTLFNFRWTKFRELRLPGQFAVIFFARHIQKFINSSCSSQTKDSPRPGGEQSVKNAKIWSAPLRVCHRISCPREPIENLNTPLCSWRCPLHDKSNHTKIGCSVAELQANNRKNPGYKKVP